MSFRRGDVVLVLFPESNLRTAKRRPAVVVQADDLGSGLPQTVVAMISGNMARGGHPSRIILRRDADPHHRTGLLTDSVVMTDNLATVLNSEIDCVIGALPDMSPVDRALRTTLGLG